MPEVILAELVVFQEFPCLSLADHEWCSKILSSKTNITCQKKNYFFKKKIYLQKYIFPPAKLNNKETFLLSSKVGMENFLDVIFNLRDRKQSRFYK